MSDRFMDFYGCPAFVIELSQRKYWKGCNLPSKKPSDILSNITNDGLYFDHAEIDFDNPVTDYDRICNQTFAIRKSCSLLELEGSDRKGLVLHIAKDRITWLDDMEMFVWIETRETDDEELLEKDLDMLLTAKLDWEYETDWEVKESKLLLFNSASHANDISLINDHASPKALTQEECQIIHLKPGVYTLSSTIHQTSNGCYRVVKAEIQ